MKKHLSPMRRRRKSLGLRQIDVVIRTGLSPATVWRADLGDTISAETQRRIAKALGVSREELFGSDPEPSHER